MRFQRRTGARAESSQRSEFSEDGPPSESAIARPPKFAEREAIACIGKSITIRGDVSADEDLVLEGRVDGRVEVPDHHLTIGANTQHVQAELAAREVTIEGRVVGSVVAEERVEIRKSGRLDGSVVAPRLSVQAGATISGNVACVAPQARSPEQTREASEK